MNSAKLIKYYKFLHDPLVDVPNQFSFFAHNRRHVLDDMRSFNIGNPLLIIGDEGSGKTVIKNIFIAELDDDIQIINLSYNKSFNCNVLDIIANKIKCSADISSIINKFKELINQANKYCLVIDDADDISYELIEYLVKLSTIIKVCLFTRNLNADNIDLNKFKIIKLPKCTDVQVKQYLAQRLNDAGSDIEIFNEQQLSRIYLVSKGIFKNINFVARQILLNNIKVNSKSGYKLSKPLMYGGSLGILILVSLLVFNQSYFKQRNKESKSNITNEIIEPNIQNISIVDNKNNIDNLPVTIDDYHTTDDISQNLTIEKDLSKAEDFIEVTEVLELPEVVTPVVAKVDVNKTKVKPNLPIKDNNLDSSNKLPTKVLLNPNKSKSAVKSSTNNISDVINTNNNWYKQQNSKNYCLQIIAGPSEQAIKQLVKSYGTEFNYFKKIVNGKNFYVLTYGSFASREQAQNQIINLPADIQKNKPFPLSFINIHKDLVD